MKKLVSTISGVAMAVSLVSALPAPASAAPNGFKTSAHDKPPAKGHHNRFGWKGQQARIGAGRTKTHVKAFSGADTGY